MSQNPYESPSDLLTSLAPQKRSQRRAYAVVAGWLFFLLLPTFGVVASHAYPGPPFLDAPPGDTILSRVSLALATPMEPILFGSLLGCVASAACFPVTPRWKVVVIFNAIVWWFLLVVLQIIALTLALLLLGYPPVT